MASSEARVARVTALGAIGGGLVTGLFGLAFVQLQVNAAREDVLRSNRIAAYSRYIDRMLDEEVVFSRVAEILASGDGISATRRKALIGDLNQNQEALTTAKSAVDLLASDGLETGAPVNTYGPVSGQLRDDVTNRAVGKKLEHKLASVRRDIEAATQTREAFTTAANRAVAPRATFFGLW